MTVARFASGRPQHYTSPLEGAESVHKQVMVFPFTVPLDAGGRMRDAAQGAYARSLARTLAERLSVSREVQATAAALAVDHHPVQGAPRPAGPGRAATSRPWSLDDACAVGLPAGTEYLVHGASELTDRVRLRVILVDQARHRTALDHVVVRPRAELFSALEDAAGAVAAALGAPLPEAQWPTSDVEAYVAYLRGRDLSAAHEVGDRVADPAKSFDPYLEAARRDPAFADAQDRLLSLALDFALGGAGPVEAARAACHALLQADPSAYKAHGALAEIDLAQGEPAEAIAQLRDALRLRPDFWPAYERLGTALARMGRHDEAIGWFERALAEKPDEPDALQGLAASLLESGRLEEAVRAFRYVLEGEGGDAGTHQSLATALVRLGRNGEAREHRRIARKLTGRGAWTALRDAWDRLIGAVRG
jgi:tetratricopeptide (TPR) repeat protein